MDNCFIEFCCVLSNINMNLIYFVLGCFGSWLLCRLFLELWRVEATLQVWHLGFSLWWLHLLHSMGSRASRLQQLQHEGSVVAVPGALENRLNKCGTWAQLLRGMWDLPRPGIEPVSPALAGRFFTIEPPFLQVSQGPCE